MLIGHYAPALIAHRKLPRVSLLLLLVAAQLQDLVWLLFHYLGLEPTAPASVFDATFQHLKAEMTYSHDLLPNLAWVSATGLIGGLLARNWKAGVACALLVAVHLAADLVSGYPHHLFGPATATVGMGLYLTNPQLAILIEAAFAAVCVFVFLRMESQAGVVRPRANLLWLYVVFVGGALLWFPTASRSMAETFGFASPQLGFNTLIPTLFAFNVACIWIIDRLVRGGWAGGPRG